jgi:hypothetical protein
MTDLNGVSIKIGDKVIFSRSGKSNYLQKGIIDRFTSTGVIIISEKTGKENIRDNSEFIFNGWVDEYERLNPERFLG